MPYHQLTITIPERYRDPVILKLAQLGSLGLYEEERTLIAFFPGTSAIQPILADVRVLALLLEASDPTATVRITHSLLPDADWNHAWKQRFKPIDVGDQFTILPPWERYRGGRTDLIIDPGMAFGTGHHETTRSCLLLMEKYCSILIRERFLDLGTGSGLLAIAACKMGFRYVLGVDNDPLAIEAAHRNVGLNEASGIVLREGTIDTVDGNFDMIVANLISGTLIESTSRIASHLRAEGILIESGILKGQENEVMAAAKGSGLREIERLADGKWISLVCGR